MTLHPEQQLAMLGAETLAPLVCQAVADERAELVDWSCCRLPVGALNPVTVGVYRLSGNARCHGRLIPWSLILKIIQWIDLGAMGKGFIDDPQDWNYWKREGLVHQSRIVDGWRGGLVSAKCYAVSEPTETSMWIWQEEVRESGLSPWSVERHVVAASHLGEFNGAHVGYLPSAHDARWLCRRFVDKWKQAWVRWGLNDRARDAGFWNHPYSRLAFHPGTQRRLLQLVADSAAFCDLLAKQSQTLSHQDTSRSNLLATRTSSGREQTTALDWSFVGIAAIGEDLGTQVGGNLCKLFVDPAQAKAYYDAAFEAYLDGLRQAGWHGDIRRVRFACAAAACLRWATYEVMWLGGCIEADANDRVSGIEDLARDQGLSIEETLRRWGLAIRFLFDVADDARLWASRL